MVPHPISKIHVRLLLCSVGMQSRQELLCSVDMQSRQELLCSVDMQSLWEVMGTAAV